MWRYSRSSTVFMTLNKTRYFTLGSSEYFLFEYIRFSEIIGKMVVDIIRDETANYVIFVWVGIPSVHTHTPSIYIWIIS